ncbi:hypothetical protein A6A25_16315 [Saccharothrix sp. CB00851]|nr:hypothetical protein A6A25_16315 [Saccharothrix sp. CB00851]
MRRPEVGGTGGGIGFGGTGSGPGGCGRRGTGSGASGSGGSGSWSPSRAYASLLMAEEYPGVRMA